MKITDINIDTSVQGKVQIGVLQFSNINCQKKNEAMWLEIYAMEENYRKKFPTPSDALEFLKPARKLYHAFNMEPTRFRPSSEALLRRVIKNKSLYQINSIVDMGNYASLHYLLPIGLYDLLKVEGNITFRLGEAGEEYAGIGKDMIHVQDRLTLVDEKGPFGNPSSDSDRTCIDLNTNEVLFVIFADANFDEIKLIDFVDFAEEKMLKFHSGAKLDGKTILK